MLDRITRVVFVLILSAAVIVSGFLGYQRHVIESASRTVELAMDWRDIQTMAALSKFPTDKLLTEIKARGITSIGVFEETLSDANALGEIYFAGGSGVMRFKELNPVLSGMTAKNLIKPDDTYILSYNPEVRKRFQAQIHNVLPKGDLKNIGEKVIDINESNILLKDIGFGISEALKNYLSKKGFSIIPRIANDPRYNIPGKIASLNGYDTIIFDGEKILGYPDGIVQLSQQLKKYKIKYGNVEIVKQDGDSKLKHLMGDQIVRVHSIPKDELLKLNKDEALTRFNLAARERNIRLIYVRPFLPPQIDEDPVKYNLQYLSEIKSGLEQAGFAMGKASTIGQMAPLGWEIILLGCGAVILTLLLLNLFVPLPWYVMWPVFLVCPLVMVYVGAGHKGYPLEKGLALLTAVITPAYAVISQYGKMDKAIASGIIFNSLMMVVNVVAECAIGIFLIIGLLASTNFMLAAEEFVGVKLTLILPVLIVIAYFMPKSKEKLLALLDQKIKVSYLLIGLFLAGVLAVMLARSGNFTLPVPGFEKYARQLLETMLGVRPRTKEFLIGYPFLVISSILLLKDKKNWLWLSLAIGVIGPASLINTFTHIHSPITISIVRSVNGLILGLLIGALLGLIYKKLPIK